MKKITDLKAIKITQLNNDEYAQFITGVVNLVQNATPEKIFLTEELFSTLKKKLNDLTNSVRQTRISKETAKITELDKKRGELVVFLLSSFRFEQKNIIKERKEAASFLYKVCKNYLGIQSLPIRQKSHAISGLILDLEKPENKEKLQVLGVTDALNALNQYNQEFQKLIEGRAESQLTNTLPNARKIRKEIDEIYKYITKCAFAMNITNKTEESSNFISLLNKLIEDTSNANKQRLGKITSTKPIKSIS